MKLIRPVVTRELDHRKSDVSDLRPSFHVMAGFMPAIHVFLATLKQGLDGRDKPGHDDR
jgi:hypothetical protein